MLHMQPILVLVRKQLVISSIYMRCAKSEVIFLEVLRLSKEKGVFRFDFCSGNCLRTVRPPMRVAPNFEDRETGGGPVMVSAPTRGGNRAMAWIQNL